MMCVQLFFLCLAAALLEMDTTYAFQLTFSRGIIAGPLLSLITGDLITGLQVGIFTELLFADINPLGGVLPPTAVGCCAVTLALTYLGVPLYIAFFLGVVCAFCFSHIERALRKRRSRWIEAWEQRVLRRPAVVNKMVILSLCTSFVITFLLLNICVLVSAKLTLAALPFLSERMHLAFKFAFVAVPWIGITTLISSFRLKTR